MNALDPHSVPVPGVDRRTLLKMAGAAGLVGTLAQMLAPRRAPAFAQGTKLHLLQWVDFIPEGEIELRRQIAE